MKLIKSSFVIGLMFSCILISLTPNISADRLINFESNLLISWDSSNTSEPLIPISGIREYNFDIEYSVRGTTLGSRIIYPLFYQGKKIDIKLNLKKAPDWTYVTIPKQTIEARIPAIGKTNNYDAVVQISLKEFAPAFKTGVVEIQFVIPTYGRIQGFEQVLELSIKPGYRALIDVSPQISSKIIRPMDSAVFAIDITNQGNAVTKCFLEIVGIEPGWSALVDDTVTIDAGEGQKETFYLTVFPPKGFGSHDDKTSISIAITPTWAENTAFRGNTEKLSLIVESKGFISDSSENQNTNTIMYIVIIGTIIVLVSIFIFLRMGRKRRGG